MAGERILIVDDDEDVLLIVQTILDNAGYATLTARNGREGVEKALEARPQAVLLDVMMPELSGWEVARRLKDDERTADVPIIFLSARTQESDRQRGQEIGVAAYVTKPFDPTELMQLVRRLCGLAS